MHLTPWARPCRAVCGRGQPARIEAREAGDRRDEAAPPARRGSAPQERAHAVERILACSGPEDRRSLYKAAAQRAHLPAAEQSSTAGRVMSDGGGEGPREWEYSRTGGAARFSAGRSDPILRRVRKSSPSLWGGGSGPSVEVREGLSLCGGVHRRTLTRRCPSAPWCSLSGVGRWGSRRMGPGQSRSW